MINPNSVMDHSYLVIKVYYTPAFSFEEGYLGDDRGGHRYSVTQNVRFH
jgi:hypothetical protein